MRTWNLDGLRKHAKAISERTKTRSRGNANRRSAALPPEQKEKCARCGVERWFHEHGTLRPDHDFVQEGQ